MDCKTLYVGMDSTQYSNGMFQEGKRTEICASIFSEKQEDLKFLSFTEKRDFSILKILGNSRYSVSMTVNGENHSLNIRPLIYSAAPMAAFFIKEIAQSKFDRIEFHFDGPIFAADKQYLQSMFQERIVAKEYRKYPQKQKNRIRYYAQPRIVVAADCLANKLFSEKKINLALNISHEKFISLELILEDIAVKHYHLCGY